LSGRAWVYGDDVNTDLIIAGRYLHSYDPEELAKHAFEDLDATFAQEVRAGDVVVGGSNFGCGSSREQAASCLVGAGISAVVAVSFARIFFRNSINRGLPVLVCPGADTMARKGDELEVDVSSGIICNITSGKEFHANPLPDEVMHIVNAGGLVPYVQNRLLEGRP